MVLFDKKFYIHLKITVSKKFKHKIIYVIAQLFLQVIEDVEKVTYNTYARGYSIIYL